MAFEKVAVDAHQGAEDEIDGSREGLCANIWKDEERPVAGRTSSGDCLEQFFERGCRVECETGLALSHHVNHFNAGQCDGG